MQIKDLLPTADKHLKSCPHTGDYYYMRTMVAVMHQVDKSNPKVVNGHGLQGTNPPKDPIHPCIHPWQ